MRKSGGSDGGGGREGRGEGGAAMVPTWKTEAEDLEFVVIIGYMVISREKLQTNKKLGGRLLRKRKVNREKGREQLGA